MITIIAKFNRCSNFKSFTFQDSYSVTKNNNEVDEAIFMSKITFKDIYIDGNKITEDSRKVIYILPSQPLKYASNTFIKRCQQ